MSAQLGVAVLLCLATGCAGGPRAEPRPSCPGGVVVRTRSAGTAEVACRGAGGWVKPLATFEPSPQAPDVDHCPVDTAVTRTTELRDAAIETMPSRPYAVETIACERSDHVRHGPWIERDHAHVRLGFFRDGVKHGTWRLWTAGEGLREEEHYDAGVLRSHRSWTWDGLLFIEDRRLPDGSLLRTQHQRDGSTVVTRYERVVPVPP